MVALFSPAALVRQMLAFEAALARAQARAGVIPVHAADAIADACRLELFDVAALYRDAVTAGTLAIPLVRALGERAGSDAIAYVHWAATSQDVIDSALMLQMRDGLDALVCDLRGVAAECARLADAHRVTVMPGRTLLQQATPITFGLKAARWLALAVRQARAVHACRTSGLALQFGGASGTLAALGDHGLPVAHFLAEELQLPLPDLPWHAERDRIGVMAATLGVVAGGMAKIATDIVLLGQSEVGEVAESAVPGKGISSAMPQKRNPVDATSALAAARLCTGQVFVVLTAMAQEHERAVGGWQAEWVAIPALFGFAAGAVSHVAGAIGGLQVNPERMRANLALGGGMIMAESLTMSLATTLGRPDALTLVQHVVSGARESGRSLHDQACEDPSVRAVLTVEAIDRALDPSAYLGSSEPFIDRALASFRALEQELGPR